LHCHATIPTLSQAISSVVGSPIITANIPFLCQVIIVDTMALGDNELCCTGQVVSWMSYAKPSFKRTFEIFGDKFVDLFTLMVDLTMLST
jgi:hypothetical protein